MKQKEITLCGKQVMIGYCFATEFAFKRFTGVNLDGFDGTDPEHIMYLILSGIAAYYQKNKTDAPIKDEDLMYESNPKELLEALNEVLNLRAEWYEELKGKTVPEKSADPDRKRRKSKNA
jgi:hypothetical protein